MKGKRIILAVVSDLATDQRVHRTAMVFVRQGCMVTLIGRQLKHSLPLSERPYQTLRFKLWFTKGPCFYAIYNIYLFFYLLTKKFDLLVANDLDTLFACYLAAWLKRKPLIYDSHEFFTGVPELKNNPFARWVWKTIERMIFPRLQYVITVNDSIADMYRSIYHKEVTVVRNIPDVSFFDMPLDRQVIRQQLKVPDESRLLILQGSGINIDRGAEEAVQAMQYVDSAVLLIIGGGDVFPILRKMVSDLCLENKVIIKDKIPFDQLRSYTCSADAGLTLDKPTNLNYRLSLPNKLFDYIQAGIPVLASDIPEVKKIIEQYDIGLIIECHEPHHIAEKISSMFADADRYSRWKANVKRAAACLTWSHEEKKLLNLAYEIFR